MSAKVALIITATSILAVGAGLVGVGIGLGGNGNFSYDAKQGSIISSPEMVDGSVEITDFDSLVLDTASYDISVKEGEEYQLIYHTREDNIPVVEQNGAILSVRMGEKIGVYFDFANFDKTEKVEITVPASDKVYNIDSDYSSGSIDFENIDLKGKIRFSSGELNILNSEADEELYVEMTSGDIDIENCKISALDVEISSGDVRVKNSEAESFDFEATSGNLSVNDCRFTKLNSDISSGNVSIRRLVSDNMFFSATSGDMDIEIVGKPEEYGLNLEKTSGDIRIDGNPFEDGFNLQNSSGKDIKVKLTSGNFTANFVE